jgi:hypothetical protein
MTLKTVGSDRKCRMRSGSFVNPQESTGFRTIAPEEAAIIAAPIYPTQPRYGSKQKPPRPFAAVVSGADTARIATSSLFCEIVEASFDFVTIRRYVDKANGGADALAAGGLEINDDG